MSPESPHAPPQAIEAEQAVLGALLAFPDCWLDVADKLLAGDFYRHDHQVIYAAIQGLQAQQEPVDVVTCMQALAADGELDAAGGIAYLDRLARTTPSGANAPRYAELVAEAAGRRTLQQAAMAAHRDASHQPLPDVVGSLVDAATGLTERHRRGGPRVLRDVLRGTVDGVEERYFAASEGRMVGLPTGLTDLDKLLGGLRPGQLVVVAGRPAMGKSALADGWALHAARQGAAVLLCDLEMGADMRSQRWIAGLGDIPGDRLRSGELQDEDWPGITSAVSLLADLPLHIDDSAPQTVVDIAARARRLKAKGGLGLVVVDYLQLLTPAATRRGDTESKEIGDMSRALKMLAMQIRVPVVCLSQLNREVERRPNKRPGLSDLRASGSIEQDADVVLFVYRDEVYSEDSPDKGTAELIVAKQRSGPIGMVRTVFDGARTRFLSYAAGMGE